MAKNLAQFLVYLLRRGRSWQRIYLLPLRRRCLLCDREIARNPVYRKYRVCPYCRFHYSLTARSRIELLVDEGTFRESHRSLVSLDPLSFSSRGGSYKQRLSRDQQRTGLTEAVVTGRCQIGGEKVVITVLDFGFMGGSMGSVVGEKVALAFDLARKKGVPLIAIVAGGGMRIQEGVLSLMQMAKTVSAANRLREEGMPFIAVLANPTTGQAYASFANLADIIIAEPRALIGLVPIRILQEISQHPLPLDAHTAEAHLRNGLVDLLVDREHLHDTLATLLKAFKPDRVHSLDRSKAKKISLETPTGAGGGELLKLARHPLRPTARDFIEGIFEGFVELHGDRTRNDDPGIVGGVGFIEGESVMVVGQQRPVGRGVGDGNNHMLPEGFRKAQRLMELAARFRLPVVTLIDTQGVYPGLEAEEQGIGNTVAATLSLMADLKVPVVSVIVGEGGSEAALALGVADRILMLENAVFSPVSPERAAARLYGDTARTEEAVQALRMTAQDCLQLGIVDGVVPEPPGGAHTDRSASSAYLKMALVRELGYLVGRSSKKLVKERRKKFRRMGEYTTYFREAVRQEVAFLQSVVVKGIRRRRLSRKEPGKGSKGDGKAPATGEED